jgi:hypothetical protein
MKSVWLISAVGALCCPTSTVADNSMRPGPTIAVNDQLQAIITDIARLVVPHDYEGDRHWGKTKKVVRGLYIRRDGWQIKTHRTRKAVNHGTWTRYRIDLIDPEQKFEVHLDNVRRLPDQRLAFDVTCRARLQVFGRLSQWQRGIQLISLSADLTTDVKLTLNMEVAVKVDLTCLPPDVAIEPVVRHADLAISNFRVERISRLNGPLVKRLSSSVRELLEDEIDRRRDDLPAKINRQLEKNKDHLRLSLRDVLRSQLSGLTAPSESNPEAKGRPSE